MKVLLVLVLIGLVAGLAVYYGGGIASFDPSEQGRQAKAAANPSAGSPGADSPATSPTQ